MNILILNWRDVHHPKFGGAEIVTMEHAKGWVAAGHRVTWLTAGYSGAKKQSTVEGVNSYDVQGLLPCICTRHYMY